MDAYVDTFDNTTNAQFGVLEPPQMVSLSSATARLLSIMACPYYRYGL